MVEVVVVIIGRFSGSVKSGKAGFEPEELPRSVRG
jgi:hypothetical protein